MAKELSSASISGRARAKSAQCLSIQRRRELMQLRGDEGEERRGEESQGEGPDLARVVGELEAFEEALEELEGAADGAVGGEDVGEGWAWSGEKSNGRRVG